MHGDDLVADLVLAGGGVKGIGHVGAVRALRDAGYEFARVAGTSAGSIVAALVAAGVSTADIDRELRELRWKEFRDPSRMDRVPVAGPLLSVATEYGVYEGRHLCTWLEDLLARHGVRTFGDLRVEDPDGAHGEDEAYRLVVTAADVTRGELVRLPWDYRSRYGLDPDRQRVVDAVRASMSIPLFFEPVTLTHADGTRSVLVDGGVLSNFPIDVFDRTDGRVPRWPTFGVTLLPRLPEANIELLPFLPGLRGRGLAQFLECLITTTVVGRDQERLSKPWVAARTILVDTMRVGVVEFDVDDAREAELVENGAAATRAFLEHWDFDEYKRRFRAQAVLA